MELGEKLRRSDSVGACLEVAAADEYRSAQCALISPPVIAAQNMWSGCADKLFSVCGCELLMWMFRYSCVAKL
jgi:hypothetical protein